MAQPAAAMLRVEILLAPVVPQPVVAPPVISSEGQKILGQFLKLTPPRFTRTQGEDAMEFLSSCEERLRNLGLVEARGVDFVSYQFDTAVRRWWSG